MGHPCDAADRSERRHEGSCSVYESGLGSARLGSRIQDRGFMEERVKVRGLNITLVCSREAAARSTGSTAPMATLPTPTARRRYWAGPRSYDG